MLLQLLLAGCVCALERERYCSKGRETKRDSSFLDELWYEAPAIHLLKF